MTEKSAELCSFYRVNDYEDKIPKQSVSEKFNNLKEDAFKDVLTDINSINIELKEVRKKINVNFDTPKIRQAFGGVFYFSLVFSFCQTKNIKVKI